MRFNATKAAQLAGKRGLSVGQLLAEAGVSRNAYYHLARQTELAPPSLLRLARTLKIGSSELLSREPTPTEEAAQRWAKVDSVAKAYPEVDRDNIRHTLILLEEKPEERLRRALQRGRRTNFQ